MIFGSLQSYAYLKCNDSLGRNIAYIQKPIGIQAAEANTASNGTPLIIVSLNLYSQLDPAVAEFTNAHECAHHYYGHLTGGMPRNPKHVEFDADCFAIKYMRTVGHLNPAAFAQVRQFLGGLIADRSHPSGQDRVQYAVQCANAP